MADQTFTAAHVTGQPELSVVIASDDPFSRMAFKTAAGAPGINVVAAADVRAVVGGLAAELDPDVVVLDVQIPAVEALEALRRLRENAPRARVLAFSAPATTAFGLLCINAGASGYLSKEIDLAVMPRILRSASRDEAVISREFATELVRRLQTRGHRGPATRQTTITASERRVLELFRTGRSLPEAAAELRISVSTASRHLAASRRKLAAPALREASPSRPSGGRRRVVAAQPRETT